MIFLGFFVNLQKSKSLRNEVVKRKIIFKGFFSVYLCDHTTCCIQNHRILFFIFTASEVATSNWSPLFKGWFQGLHATRLAPIGRCLFLKIFDVAK